MKNLPPVLPHLKALRFPVRSLLFFRLKIKILAFLSFVSGKQRGHNSPPPLGRKKTIYRIVLLFLALTETENSFLSLKVASLADGHKLLSCSLPDLLVFFYFRAQEIINISLNSTYNLWLLLSFFFSRLSSKLEDDYTVSTPAHTYLGRMVCREWR